MTLNESLQFGILCYCADQGMTQEETHALVKRAADKQAVLAWIAGKFIDVPTKLLTAFGPGALATTAIAAAGVPIVAGIAGGYGLAKATEREIDPDEMKGDEVIEQYRLATDQARRQALLKGIRGVPTLAQGAAA